MVGGGFGGSAVVLVDADRTDDVARAITDRFAQQGFPPLRAFAVVPSAGARRLA
jgi:galactokinase